MNLKTNFAFKSAVFAAALTNLVFAGPMVKDAVAQAGPGNIAEDLDEAANCAEMLAVTSALAGTDNENNTTACGPANVFAVESDQLNEKLDVTHEDVNQANFNGDNGKINVPTGAKPSPLFGAEPFTMKMLREEEFGPVKLGDRNNKPSAGNPFPPLTGARSGPVGQDLDSFLARYI